MNTRIRINLAEPHPHMGPLISSYQDGLTDPHETETVERHLLECERCRAYFDGLQQVREVIEDLPNSQDDSGHVDVQFQAVLNRTVYSNKRKPPAERGLKKFISDHKPPGKSDANPAKTPENNSQTRAKRRAKNKAS